MNSPVTREQLLPAQLTATDIRQHVNLIQTVMKEVMKENVHFGKIPGTDKPSLFKPGAEKICETFRIAPSYQVEDLSARGFVRYRVRCTGTHQTTGLVLGEGMGECSSLETKYRWRKAASIAEFNNTPENLRQIKYGYNKTQRQEYEIRQVAAESADLANTILKMACKRAMVAMCLTVTAASDLFTQDIEDLPPELLPDDDGGDTTTGSATQDQRAGTTTKPPFAADQFATALANYKKLIVGKKKTPDEIIATAQAKYTLTDEQVAQIRALATTQESTQ